MRFWRSMVMVSALLLIGGVAWAKAPKAPAFVPKQDVERQSVVFAFIPKRFILAPDLDAASLARLMRIENATLEIDAAGQVPPKSLLQSLGTYEGGLQLVLPLTMTDGHRRRLAETGRYDAVFRTGADSLSEETAAQLLALGPRRKVFVVNLADLTPAFAASIKRVKSYELRVMVPDGETPSPAALKLLESLGGGKELVVDSNTPEAVLGKLARLKKTLVVLRVHGAGPSPELAAFLSAQKKGMGFGLWVRGLIKPEEVAAYRQAGNVRLLVMDVENWAVNDGFVRLMNSHGEF